MKLYYWLHDRWMGLKWWWEMEANPDIGVLAVAVGCAVLVGAIGFGAVWFLSIGPADQVCTRWEETGTMTCVGAGGYTTCSPRKVCTEWGGSLQGQQ